MRCETETRTFLAEIDYFNVLLSPRNDKIDDISIDILTPTATYSLSRNNRIHKLIIPDVCSNDRYRCRFL